MERRNISVSTGFVVLMALLFYLDQGVGLLIPGVAACALHELGHVGSVYAVGGSIKRLNFTIAGAELVLDPEKPLSYGKELFVALAGPLSSFLCAWLSSKAGLYLVAGMCLGQGIFNFLPVLPLDGGRTLHALLSLWGNDVVADHILSFTSVILIGALLGLGGILLLQYQNPTLTITAFWLLLSSIKRKNRKKNNDNEIMLAKSGLL